MFKKRLLLRGLSILGLAFLMGVITWYADAQETPLEFDSPVSAALEVGGTSRWQFEAYRDDVITLTINRTEGDLIPVLSLLNEENQLQAQIRGDADGTAALVYRIPHFGHYIVQIGAQGETQGSYTLVLSLSESGRRDFEQGSVDFGEPVVQQIDDTIPYHVWTFTGTTAQVVDINVEVLEGDLQPVLALTSPGGINLGRTEGENEVRLLAVRLPGNGTYEVLVRRRGDNFGFGGETSGRYRLEITLRNGPHATANTLEVDELTPGRLTLDSPLARYSVETVGMFMAEIELSRSNCLIDLNIFSNGPLLKEHIIGQSPLRYPVEFISVQPHILEIASVGCPDHDGIGFVVRLRPLQVDLPIYILPENEPIYGTSERWLFEGQSGELIRLSFRHTDLQEPLDIRILAPDRSVLYRSNTQPELDQILALPADGYYIVEVSASSPYQIRKLLVGQNNQLFSVVRPIQEQVLDVTDTKTWRITADTRVPTVLTVEAPSGEIIRTARSTQLNGPQLNGLTLSEPGRYRIRLYAEQRPVALDVEEILDSENILQGTVKAILNDEDDYHRWQLPLRVGDILKLRLENLTPGTRLPSLALVDQTGVYLYPEYQISDDNQVELIGLRPDKDSIYTVVVNNAGDGGQLAYRLDAAVEDSFMPAPPNTLSIETGVGESFVSTSPVPPVKDYLTPGFTERDLALLEDAVSVSIPNLIRGEIKPNEWRQVWRLNVVRSQLVSLTATSLENKPAPGIMLLNADGTPVIEHWEHDLPVNHVLYRTPTASIYYLVVTGDVEGGAYLLDMSIVPGLDETIPTMQDVVPIRAGDLVPGEFLTRDEIDTYVFWGRQNSVVALTAYYELGGFVPEIQLVGPRGNVIEDASFSQDQNFSRLETPSLAETGLYTVHVSALQREEESDYGRYTLLVALVQGQMGDEAVLEGVDYGTITRSFDENIWIFRAESGESVDVVVEPLEIGAPSNLTVALADSDGEEFYFQRALLSESRVTMRDIMLPRTGLYQVKVRGEFIGRYRITLTRDATYLTPGDHATAYGDTVSGVFTQGNVVDRWLLAGNQGDVIAVAVRPVRGDLASVGFEIEAPDGTVVAVGVTTDSTGARTENIVLPTAGIYSLLVGTPDVLFAGSMAYDLSVELQNRTARSSGTLIPYNSTHTGIIFADDTRDVWLFEGKQGDVIRVAVTGDGAIQPAFSLTAFNAQRQDGQYVPLLSRTGTTTQPARLVEYTLPDSGAYAITVSGVSGSTGSYTFDLTALQQSNAVTLPLNSGQTLPGNIKPGAREVWTVEGTAGDVLDVQVEPIRRSGLAPNIRVLGPTGDILVQATGRSGSAAAITSYALPSNGTYQIIVQPASEGDTQGRYEITLSLLENGTLPPGSLSYDEAAIGVLSDEKTVERRFFEGQAGDVVRVAALRTSDDLDTLLTLYDPAGQIIAWADDSVASTDSEITLTLPQTGQYLVEVARFGRERGFTSGNYRLDLALLYRPGNMVPEGYLAYGEQVTDRILPDIPAPQTWYFVGQEGDEVSIHLQFPASNIPLLLSLSDGANNLLQEGERVRERTSIRNFRLPADGIYQISIQTTRRITTGEYIPYHLGLDLVAGERSTDPQGGLVQHGDSVAGTFEGDMPVHLWLYEGQAGEQVLLSILGLEGITLPDMTIFAPDGRILSNLRGELASDTNSVSLILPESGFYQIAVINTRAESFLSYRLAVNGGLSDLLAGQLFPGRTGFGYLADAAPSQNWLYEGQAGQVLAVQAIGDLSFSVRLENPDGAVLASSQDDPLTGQTIIAPLTLQTDGAYRIVVTREGGILGNGQGGYQIRVSSSLTIPEALSAQPLESSVPVTGSVSARQKTYYIFYAESGTPISLEFVPERGEGQPEIRLLDENGQLITRSTGSIENLIIDQSGYFLIEVASSAPLSFTLTVAARPQPDEELVVLLERDVTTVADLSQQTPVNYWAIDAAAGESLMIEVKAFTNAQQVDLILFDPDGSPMRALIAQDSETILGPVFIPRDGTYVLRVGTWLNLLAADESGYSVRVINAADGETLGSDGSSLLTGQPVFGGISDDDPQDRWMFEALAGSRLSLVLETIGGDAELDVVLFMPDGIPLEIQTSANGDTVSVEGVLVPVNGVYTLEVNQIKANSADATAYKLLVSETKSPLESSLSQAQGLELGQPVSGEITSSAELDAWVFFANQGQTVTIESESSVVLTLVSPNGIPLYANAAGRLEQVLLLEDGLYSVVVSAIRVPLAYTLQVKPDTVRTNWRWSLRLGQFEQVVLTTDSPVHEWLLNGYQAGEYTIAVRPTSQGWQAKTYVISDTNQIVSVGEVQPDGSTFIRLYLDSATSQTYSLIVTSDLAGGTYQVLFDAGVNATIPEPISEGTPVTGRINVFDTADEWLWQGSPTEPITIEAERLEGDFTLGIRVFAPGNLFLQEYVADEEGRIRAENILLPVQGTYIIQVIRTEDVFSAAQGVYQMRIEANPVE